MTLALADVCDLECVVSTNPLVLDLAAAETYVRGADAIVRRVVVAWAQWARLLDIEGTLSDGERFKLRTRLRALAEAEPFVRSCSVSVDMAEPNLRINAVLVLDDGTTSRFEVTTGEAAKLTFGAAA